MTVREICHILNQSIPLYYQESYDNSGIQVGNPDMEVNSALLALNVTEEVIDEAVNQGAGIIISHHPLIYSGFKSLTGKNNSERAIIKALKNDIAVYSAHTNLDIFEKGVSHRMAMKLGLKNLNPLKPLTDRLLKLVVFVPEDHGNELREVMFKAGAGQLGNYDRCSYNLSGKGTFRASDTSNPWSGTRGQDHTQEEVRIETIVPENIIDQVVKAVLEAHPYEEVAYDIYKLENIIPGAGLGCVGNLAQAIDEGTFIEQVAELFMLEQVKYSPLRGKPVKRVAVCGGSGSSLIGDAIKSGADMFITADIKYHSYFEPEGKLVLADIGHHESELCSLEILNEIISKKIPKFAVLFSKINTNPINYLRAWKK